MKKEIKKQRDQLIKILDKLRDIGCDGQVLYNVSAAIQLLTNDLNKS